MSAGFGVDPTRDGANNITSGTTSQDIRQINGALYSPGIISGCNVTLDSSGMNYNVSAGVAVIPMATGENVLAAVPAQQVPVAAVPTSGSRTDYIYAYQNIPALDGDSSVQIKCDTSVPLQRAVQLDAYKQPAGATVTSNGTRAASITYSVPYSGHLGQLYRYDETYNGQLVNSLTRVGNGSFYLPTKRYVRVTVSAVLSAANATKFDNNNYCEFGFLPNFDNNDVWYWTTSGLHQAWQTSMWSDTLTLNAGNHTTNLGIQRVVGPGNALCHYGRDNQGLWRSGIVLTVDDAGPAA